MPINTNEILNVVQQLAEQRDVKVTLKESLKGASIVGLSVFTGSVLAGPLGMLLGNFICNNIILKDLTKLTNL